MPKLNGVGGAAKPGTSQIISRVGIKILDKKQGHSTGSFRAKQRVTFEEDQNLYESQWPEETIDLEYFKKNQVRDFSDTNFVQKVLDRAFPS